MPYRTISSCRPAWLSGRCRSSIRAPYTCCQDGPITPASQPGAATASASSAARSVSPASSSRFSSRIAPSTWVESVRCRPPALTRPSPARRSSSASSARLVRSPATSRDRNSLSTLASKPGSSSSRPSAYFHVIRSRTASAACRSVRFSENCRTLAIISWPGEIPGRPAPRTRRQTAHRHTPRPAHRGSASPGSPAGRRTRHPRRELGNIRPGPRLHRHDHTILRPGEGRRGKATAQKIMNYRRAAAPEAPRRAAE